MAIYYKSRLPSIYQEVEYIESSGTQYIDTGYEPQNYFGIDMFFSFSSISSAYQTPFSAGTGGSQLVVVIRDSATYFRYFSGSASVLNTTLLANTRYNLQVDKNGRITFNNVSTTSAYSAPLSSNETLFLFARANQENYAYIKLYSCKLYNNGVLVRNFVPCYRKSDNEIGLYDLVNGVFYTNQGTGTFTKGNDVLTKIASVYQGTTRMTKIYKGEQCVFNDLPKGYTKCEYIESTGTQYIDTGYKPNQDTLTKMNMNLVSFNGNDVPYGSRVAFNDNQYEMTTFPSDYKPQFRFNSFNTSSGGTLGTPISIGSHKIETSKNGLFIDDVQIGDTPTSQTFTCINNLFLFARNTQGTAGAFANIKLYSCQIYDNGTLVRNFIPCLDTNGTPCLYDTVSKQPFYNQGSGTFKYKVKLPSGYQQVEYIESTGTQYVDTNVLITNNSKLTLDISFNSNTDGDYVNGISGNFSAGRFAVGNGYGNYTGFYFGVANENLWAGTRDTNRHKFFIDMPNLTYGIDNTVYNKTAYTYPTFTNNYFCLFARNQKSNIGSYAKQKFYSCQIYDNGTIVRNFIPCYRISDNVIGLYDMINRKFYTNAGTGTFLKGADV